MKVFVFDLDFTIWDAGGTWCDATHPPYRWENKKLFDSHGDQIRLYNDVPEILELLKRNDKHLAVASRTYRPDWARDLLHLFKIDMYFDLKEIYPGSKIKHFNNIKKYFNVKYHEMVFFDDEYRNIQEVGHLGVKTIYVENGLNLNLLAPYCNSGVMNNNITK